MTNPVTLITVMTFMCALGVLVERLAPSLLPIGSAGFIMVSGLLLSTMGVIPHQSPVYGILMGPVANIAMVLILFTLQLQALRYFPRRLLGLFMIGVIATTLAALLVLLVDGPAFNGLGIKLVVQMYASYIGGSENAVMMKKMMHIPHNYFTGLLAVDNVVTALWMIICIVLGQGSPPTYFGEANSTELTPTLTVTNLMITLVCGLLAYQVSLLLAEQVGGMNAIIYLTAVAVLIAQMPWLKRLLAPAYVIGSVLFMLFFFAIGAMSDLTLISGLETQYWVVPFLMVLFHGVITLTLGRTFGFSWLECGLISQCLIGGPALAIAYASAKKWSDGAYVGIFLGTLGYALANFLGAMLYYSLNELAIFSQ